MVHDPCAYDDMLAADAPCIADRLKAIAWHGKPYVGTVSPAQI